MEIYNKNKSLSDYGFACGYMENLEIPINNGIRVSIYKENGVYHVSAFDHKKGNRLKWESFHLLKAARAEFYRLTKKMFNLTKDETIKTLVRRGK